ncbi:MAG: ABC transporter ATP-binding protein [Burkholderiales bacterium]
MTPPVPVVALSGVRFSWSGDRPAALSLDALHLRRGEHVFVQGPSGSGKSTLLSLLAGIATPQAGTVSVLGQDLSRLSAAARDRFRVDHLGVIFQMFNLIPYLPVLENVALPCRFSPARRARAEAQAGSVEAAARRLLSALDLGDDVLGRPVTTLSVGQQQRVAAARSLIGNPALILADEPTSALDADRRDAFIDLLFRECAAAGATLIFVSHDRALSERFARVLSLDGANLGAPVS